MIYLQLVLTAMVWGGTFIAGRLAVQEISPFSAAFLRFAIAVICLLAMVYRQEGGLAKLKRDQFWQVVVLGLSGVFAYNIFFFKGLQVVAASRAALIVALNPIAIAIASAFILQERLSPLKLLGIITSLIGAAIVIGKGNPLELLAGGMQSGDVLILGCVVSWAVYTLVGKQVLAHLSPLATTTYACGIGAAALFPFALQAGLGHDLQQISSVTGFSLLYLGFFGSALGFSWYYTGVQAIGAAKAAIFINLVPVSAIALAWLILREPIDLSIIIGGGLVVTGVFCTNRG
jgi:drug/metabolite transporter (DMT)-like permease